MKFTPLRISLIYICAATLWIVYTDIFFEWFFGDVGQLSYMQTLKGLLFAFTTGGILYWMVMKFETSLNREQELFNKIFETIPVMITIYRPDISNIRVNQEFEKVTGWSNKEIRQINIMEKVYPDDEYRKEMQEFMQHPNGDWKDIELVTKSGLTLQTSWTNIRLSDDTQIGIGLDITERKQIEKELQSKEEWLKLTTTSSNIGMWEWNPKTGETVFDEVWANLVGYTLEELQPISIETWNSLVHPDDLLRFEKVVERYFSGKTPIYECEIRMKHKKGHWVWILDRGQTIEWDEKGCPTRLVGTHVDITYRKKIEQEIERERELFKTTSNLVSDVVYDWDAAENKIYWNDGITSIFGYKKKELGNGLTFWVDNIYHEDRERVLESYQKAIQNRQETWKETYRFLTSDREIRYVEDNCLIVLDADGHVKRTIGAIIDLTEARQATELIEYHAGLLDEISDAVISTDIEGTIISWNKAAEDTYGWTRSEAIGKNAEKLLIVDYLDSSHEEATQALLDDGIWQAQIVNTTKQGKKRDVLISVKVLRGPDGSINGSVTINRDITEKILVEKENRLLGDLFIRSNTALAISNHKTAKLERVNLTYARLFGYEIDEMKGLNITRLYAESHLSDPTKLVDLLTKHGHTNFESVLKKKNGETFPALINLSLLKDKSTGSEYRLSTVLDITELKEIERKLEQEQKRFEVAANITSDVVWEWDPGKQTLWWGEGIESVLGYKKEQYEGKLDFWKNNITEKDRERVYKSMMEAENSDATIWSEDYEFIAADGSIKKINDTARIIRQEDGSIIRIIGSMVNRTKEIEYQEAIKHQSYKFEMIAKSLNDVLYEWNIKTNEIWWSDGWQTRFDFPEDEVKNTIEWWQSIIHPASRKKITNSLQKAVDNNAEAWVEYYKLKNGRGDYSVVIDKGYFLKDRDGNAEYMFGSISDITADVNAREELKASEEQYRLLFKQSPLPMFIFDPATLNFVAANNSALEKYKYSLDELRTMKIFELHPKDDHKLIKKEIDKNLKQKRTESDTWHHVNKFGKKMVVEISGTYIHYDGKPQRLAIVNDITKQKRAEERAISAIVEGEERERQRIAKELHDGLGQYLSAANMNLKSVFEDLAEIPENLAQAYKSGLEFLNYAISETRNISQNLLPKAIQDYGLELAAESLINHLRSNNNIQIYFYKNLGDVVIPDTIQINLYRILQESLNNAIRHGKPAKIDVQLVYSKGEILLSIEDNGLGFDTNRENELGIGFRSIKTRVGAMSANLDIVSNKNRGTSISVVVPINEKLP